MLKSILSKIGVMEYLRFVRDRRHESIRDFDIIVSSQQKRINSSSDKTIAILPVTAPPSSLGDEALIKGLVAYYNPLGFKIKPIAFSETDKWEGLPEPIGVIPRDTSEWAGLTKMLSSVAWLYVIGADVMDGAYGIKSTAIRLQLAAAANALGIGVTITGFSFNDSCPKVLIEQYKKISKDVSFCLRDPLSSQRFDKATGHSSQQVADLAFYMEPEEDNIKNNPMYQWVKERRKEGRRKVLGLNISPHIAQDNYSVQDSQRLGALVELYDEGVSSFLKEQKNYDVILIPHDYRGILSDLNLALILTNRLQHKFGKDRVKIVDWSVKASEIKAIVKEVNIVFAGRMHLAIACISVGTPVSCFTYQDKFEGLFNLVDLDMSLLASVHSSSSNQLKNMLVRLAEEEAVLRQRILTSKDKLEELASGNFFSHIETFKKGGHNVLRK